MSRLDDILTAVAARYNDATVSFEAGKNVLNKHAQQRKIILARADGNLKFSSAPGRMPFGVAVDGAGTLTKQRFERSELIEATIRAADETALDAMFDRFVNSVFEVFGPNAFEDVNPYEWFQGDSTAGGDWARRNPGIKLYFRVRLKSRSETSPYAVVQTATGSLEMGDETVLLPDQPVPEPPPIYIPSLVSTAAFVRNPHPAFSSSGSSAIIIPLGAFAAGDLVILAVTNSRVLNEPMVQPEGWTRLSSEISSGTAGSRVDVFYRRMLGGELPTVALEGFLDGLATTWVARHWIWRGTDPSKAPAIATRLPTASTNRTQSSAALDPGWGPVRIGWMQYIGLDRQDSLNGATPAVTAWPAGYFDPTTETTTHNASVISGCSQGSAYKVTDNQESEPAVSWSYLPSVAGLISPVFLVSIAVGGN